MSKLHEVLHLTRGEAAKLEWLVTTIKGVDSAHSIFKTERQHFKETEGLIIERSVDWQAVARHCFPTLLLITVFDKNKANGFVEHPRYVVVPRTGQFTSLVPLDVNYTLEEIETQTKSETGKLLKSLEEVTKRVEGPRRRDAMASLNVLKRILLPVD